MATTTFKLKKPIDKITIDITENSLEAVGYRKVTYCQNCEYSNVYHTKNGLSSLECSYLDREVCDYGYCSWGAEKASSNNEICENCIHAKQQFLSRGIVQLICEEDSEWSEVEPNQTCKIGCFEQK